jgi:hypothetical protein
MREFLTQTQIAKRYKRSLSTCYKLAMGKNWPPAERRIGATKLYHRDAVQFYFDTRLDGRTKEAKALKRRRRKRRA